MILFVYGKMHIPDNFLSPPVWASLDVVSLPVFGLIARTAGREMEDAHIPLLGVMGAFVFAAQMINFPVGLGTSGHLVGGALLAYALGPAFASVTMAAILAVQAFIFQDGGVLALGANVFNMAIAGVLAAYLPYQLWGRGRSRRLAIFGGAFLSVMVSAALALTELLISGVRMPKSAILISLGLFVISALLEGVITLAAMSAIEKLNPAWVQGPARSGRAAAGAVGAFAVILAAAGFIFASAAPDGLQRIGQEFGLAAKSVIHAPFADYEAPFWAAGWVRRASAGLTGIALIFGACALIGKMLLRRGSAKCTT